MSVYLIYPWLCNGLCNECLKLTGCNECVSKCLLCGTNPQIYEVCSYSSREREAVKKSRYYYLGKINYQSLGMLLKSNASSIHSRPVVKLIYCSKRLAWKKSMSSFQIIEISSRMSKLLSFLTNKREMGGSLSRVPVNTPFRLRQTFPWIPLWESLNNIIDYPYLPN